MLWIFRFPWTPVVSAPSGPKLFCYASQLQTPLFSLVRSLAPPLSSHSPEGRCVPGRVFYLGGESTRGAAPSSPLGEWLFSGFLFSIAGLRSGRRAWHMGQVSFLRTWNTRPKVPLPMSRRNSKSRGVNERRVWRQVSTWTALLKVMTLCCSYVVCTRMEPVIFSLP